MSGRDSIIVMSRKPHSRSEFQRLSPTDLVVAFVAAAFFKILQYRRAFCHCQRKKHTVYHTDTLEPPSIAFAPLPDESVDSYLVRLGHANVDPTVELGSTSRPSTTAPTHLF